jgi:hypothetical protein
LNCRKQFLVHAINLVVVVSQEAAASVVLQEHGLGTDVPLKHPDRPVSSFAAKLKFEDAIGGMIFIILYLSWIAVASFFYVTNRWCSKPVGLVRAQGFILCQTYDVNLWCLHL